MKFLLWLALAFVVFVPTQISAQPSGDIDDYRFMFVDGNGRKHAMDISSFEFIPSNRHVVFWATYLINNKTGIVHHSWELDCHNYRARTRATLTALNNGTEYRMRIQVSPWASKGLARRYINYVCD